VNLIETPEKFIMDLNWTVKELNEAKVMLNDWDNRKASYHTSVPKYIKEVDLAEREHLRNCINFWEKKLSHENQ
jgi:hypothetical protein